MGRVDGKRALVTGAASGIGRATALALAREGAAVLACDVNEAVAEVAAEGRAMAAGADGSGATRRPGIEAMVADVSDEAAVEAMFARADERLGGVDVVVANAGIVGSMKPVTELGADEWRRVLDVNLLGTFLCIKHGARRMQAGGGGSIVCTASVAGLRAGAGPPPYSASKAAILNLVCTSAAQLAGTGVRINAVCPGLIETDMTRSIFDAARAAGSEHKIGQLNPLRRAGRPDEIAALIVFLASDDASYVNGEAIAADGGLSASHPFVPGKLW